MILDNRKQTCGKWIDVKDNEHLNDASIDRVQLKPYKTSSK